MGLIEYRMTEETFPSSLASPPSPAPGKAKAAGLETIRVLSSASEVFPIVKTGGMADVVGALPKAVRPHGVEITTLVPGYPSVLAGRRNVVPVLELEVLGEAARVLSCHSEGLDLLVLECSPLYERGGGPYLDETGFDHKDNWKRFAAFSLATAKIAAEGIADWRPDVVHLHDWQTSLAGCYIRAMGLDTPVVLTIHNLAFQGQFPSSIFPRLELPLALLDTSCLKYHGDISFLKGAIVLSDLVTTVSPTYAREILSGELGMGMEGILFTRKNALRGILNGIDHTVWDPSRDPFIPARFDMRSLARRKENRRTVERQFGLIENGRPIVSVISRLTWQKGIDLLAPVVPGIVDRGAKLVIFGEGDPEIAYPLLEQAQQYPGQVVMHIGYSEAGAHLLHAGSDIVLQPSRFEPCGLTQLYALRYGAIPVVARTGGLAETIIDANEAAMEARAATGFQFQPGSVEDLYHALDRALEAFERPTFWKRLQLQAMKADFGWARSAERYAGLYRRLVNAKMGAGSASGS